MLERMHAVVQQAFGGPEVLEVTARSRVLVRSAVGAPTS